MLNERFGDSVKTHNVQGQVTLTGEVDDTTTHVLIHEFYRMIIFHLSVTSTEYSILSGVLILDMVV